MLNATRVGTAPPLGKSSHSNVIFWKKFVSSRAMIDNVQGKPKVYYVVEAEVEQNHGMVALSLATSQNNVRDS